MSRDSNLKTTVLENESIAAEAQEDSTCEQTHEDPPMNIHDFRDHGYAWVVLAAAVFTASLVTANTSSYGILLPEYVDYFQVSKSKITLIQSLCAGAAAAIGKVCLIIANNKQHTFVHLIS